MNKELMDKIDEFKALLLDKGGTDIEKAADVMNEMKRIAVGQPAVAKAYDEVQTDGMQSRMSALGIAIILSLMYTLDVHDELKGPEADETIGVLKVMLEHPNAVSVLLPVMMLYLATLTYE